MIVRAYASALRIVELPFSWDEAPIGSFEGQAPDSLGLHRFGLALVVAAIALATAASVRIGLFMLFFVVYFGGYPAVQFQTRHYFHLEFITWWAAGFVVQSAIHGLHLLIAERRLWNPNMTAAVTRTVAVFGGSIAVLALVLWVARAQQRPTARTLFESYLAAGKDEIPQDVAFESMPRGVLRTSTGSRQERAEFLAVDVNGWRCDGDTTVTFRYDKAIRPTFSRRFTVPRNADMAEPTHIFTPVYRGFQALELSTAKPGCVDGVYRVRDPDAIPLMLEVMLPPRWRKMSLYQQFGEVGPPELDAVR
jgi:hypothetical protein